MVQFDVITLFPQMFATFPELGVVGRAFKKMQCALRLWDPRDFTENSYRTVDDRPYGGGPGMVMCAEPLERTICAAKATQIAVHSEQKAYSSYVILLSPQGQPLTDAGVKQLSCRQSLILLCGRYQAIDQRLIDRCVDCEISLGDFILSGGEIPAMALMDALIRQIPGVLNSAESTKQDSFANGLLECPHYTRPKHYHEISVPEILCSGHHAKIMQWRRQQALSATLRKRPDLLENARKNNLLSHTDKIWLNQIAQNS